MHKHISCYAEKMNNPYRGGTFDVWYSGTRRDLWVEYKFIELPKRDSTVIVPELSPLQMQWGTHRKKEGRNVAVIVGCRDGGVYLTDESTWATGLTAAHFRQNVLPRRALAAHIDRFVNN